MHAAACLPVQNNVEEKKGHLVEVMLAIKGLWDFRIRDDKETTLNHMQVNLLVDALESYFNNKKS